MVSRQIQKMSNDAALRVLAEQKTDELIYQTPIRVADAASFFRTHVSKNDRPFDKEAIEYNNKLVEEWYRKVLLPIGAPSGIIQSGRVSQCFQTYFQGLELTQHEKYKKYLPSYTNEQVYFWIDIFKKSSVTALVEMGPGVVSEGWSVVRGAIKYYFADKKWEKVYGKS